MLGVQKWVRTSLFQLLGQLVPESIAVTNAKGGQKYDLAVIVLVLTHCASARLIY
eukprot:COSAG06_NODE_58125_length_278_cov_0.575419_1_plen_54_part_10